MDQIEVYPLKNGTWNWRRRVNDQTSGSGNGYETRTEAIREARKANGGEEVTLTRPDGSSAGTARIGQSELRVVLLRPDGSIYGELDAASSTGSAQHVTLTPATENGSAGTEG